MKHIIIIIIYIFLFAVGPSSAAGAPKVPSQSLLDDLTADTAAYTKQNQYFDATNMAYVLELSNRKSNQNSNVDDDDNNSNIRNSNLRVLPNYNNNHNNDKMNSANHDNNDNNHNNNNNNNHENEADEDNNSVKKKSSSAHDPDTHSDNKNYFNHYQFNNGDDLEHIDGGGGGSGGNNPLNRGPFFDVSASKNVTALVGKMANLNCRIKNLGNKTVRIKEEERMNFIYLRYRLAVQSFGPWVHVSKIALILLRRYFLFSSYRIYWVTRVACMSRIANKCVRAIRYMERKTHLAFFVSVPEYAGRRSRTKLHFFNTQSAYQKWLFMYSNPTVVFHEDESATK